jgi:hypothetical protein
VQSSAVTSTLPSERTTSSAVALSLPLLQLIHALGRAVMASVLFNSRLGPQARLHASRAERERERMGPPEMIKWPNYRVPLMGLAVRLTSTPPSTLCNYGCGT